MTASGDIRQGRKVTGVVPRSGFGGLADGMRSFPVLKEWESQIALQALREEFTVEALGELTPFRQYLGVARRADAVGATSPFGTFTSLFGASESVEMLVSYGNFQTVYGWTWTLARRHPGLTLPLDEFLQEALYRIVPYQAQSYDPRFGTSFRSFVVGMLMKRFHNFVTKHVREHTAPLISSEMPSPTEGPMGSQMTRRVGIASLHGPTPNAEGLTLLQQLEVTRLAPEDTTAADDREARRKIHILSQLAGLSARQEETLIGIFVYGGGSNLLAQMRHCTMRTVTGQRQHALESLRALGADTVTGVLTGKYATLADAEASMLRASENVVS